MSISDTPRTDAEVNRMPRGVPFNMCVTAAFARKLERELETAKAEYVRDVLALNQELSALKADKARDPARLEGGELLSLIDGAKSVVEIWQPSTPAQIKWKEEWLKNARAQIDFAIRPTPPKATEQ